MAGSRWRNSMPRTQPSRAGGRRPSMAWGGQQPRGSRSGLGPAKPPPQAAGVRAGARPGQAAREAGEVEAERRARETALSAELGELQTELADAELAAARATGVAAEWRAEQMAAEENAARAEAARQRVGEELAHRGVELAALARREESLARSREVAERRRREGNTLLEELRQRQQRLEGELAQARANVRTDPATMAGLERELAAVETAGTADRIELERQEAVAANSARELELADAALATC